MRKCHVPLPSYLIELMPVTIKWCFLYSACLYYSVGEHVEVMGLRSCHLKRSWDAFNAFSVVLVPSCGFLHKPVYSVYTNLHIVHQSFGRRKGKTRAKSYYLLGLRTVQCDLFILSEPDMTEAPGRYTGHSAFLRLSRAKERLDTGV